MKQGDLSGFSYAPSMLSFHFLHAPLTVLALWFLFDFVQGKFALGLHRGLTLSIAFVLFLFTSSTEAYLLYLFLYLIAEIDRRERRIPDLLTKPAIFLLMMIYIERHEAIALTFIWMLLMYSITHLFPGFIGRGDVKLIAALILVNELFSYIEPVRFLLLLLLVSSLIGLPGALIARKRGRTFPFAPALSVASWSIFFVPALAQIGNM